MFNDFISDLCARINNGCNALLENIEVLNSKFTRAILDVLKDEGYINGYELKDARKIIVSLKYYKHRPVIGKIKRISKPGCRVYVGVQDMKPRNDLSLMLLSTNRGVMPSYKAKNFTIPHLNINGLGGEALLVVYNK